MAQVNEVLGKVLAHNIRTVIHSQCELGIEPVFWPEESDLPPVIAFKGK